MPIVTRQELIDAQRDVADLATVVNGPANPGTLVSRNGTPLKTLSRVLLDLDPTGIATQLERLASDAWLTRDEKPQFIREWDTLSGEQSDLLLQAALENLSTAAYETAFTSLEDYLAGLNPAWNDVGFDTPIVPNDWIITWSAVYKERTALLSRLATTAHGVATVAASNANTALAQLLRIGSDNWLTTGEKRPAIVEREAALATHTDLLAKSVEHAVDSAPYVLAYDRLLSFLGALTGGGLYDLTQDSDLSGMTYPNDAEPSNPYTSGVAWRQAWTSYYVAEANLRAALAATASMDAFARQEAALARNEAQQALGSASLAQAAADLAQGEVNLLEVAVDGKASKDLSDVLDNSVAARLIPASSLTAGKLNVAVGGGNLLRNSSFEVDSDGDGWPDYWRSYGGLSAVSLSTDSVFGGKALLLTVAAGATSPRIYPTDAPGVRMYLSAGTKVVVSGYVKAPAGTTPLVGLKAWSAETAGSEVFSTSTTGIVGSGTWQRVVYALTLTSSGWVAPLFGLNGSVTSGVQFLVDAVQLEVGDVATAYAPRADELLPGSVGSTILAAGSVVAGKLAADAVTAGTIAAGAIGTRELAAEVALLGKAYIGDLQNLCANPSGESQPWVDGWTPADGWTTGGGFTLYSAPDPGYTSNIPTTRVLRWEGRDCYFDQWVDVKPGDKFHVRCMCYNPDVGPARCGLQFQQNDAANPNNWVGISIPTNSVWSEYSGTITAPATAYRARVWISNQAYPGAPTGTTHMREVSVRRMNAGELIVDGTITAEKLVSRSITSLQIYAGTITANEIATRTITADRIVARTLTANEIYARSITANEIATGTLTANEIAGRTITGDRIAAGAISAYEISVTSLSAISANLGTVTAGVIQVTDNMYFGADRLTVLTQRTAGTIGSWWQPVGGIGGINVARSFNTVCVNLRLMASSASALWTNIGTLPEDLRPGLAIIVSGFVSDSSSGTFQVARFQVSNSGVISITGYDNGTNIQAMFPIGTGDGAEAHFTFIV